MMCPVAVSAANRSDATSPDRPTRSDARASGPPRAAYLEHVPQSEAEALIARNRATMYASLGAAARVVGDDRVVVSRDAPPFRALADDLAHAATRGELATNDVATRPMLRRLAEDFRRMRGEPPPGDATLFAACARAVRISGRLTATTLRDSPTADFVNAVENLGFARYGRSAPAASKPLEPAVARDLLRRALITNSIVNQRLAEFRARPSTDSARELNRVAALLERLAADVADPGFSGKARFLLDYSAAHVLPAEPAAIVAPPDVRVAEADVAAPRSPSPKPEPPPSSRFPLGSALGERVRRSENSARSGVRFEAHAAGLAQPYLLCFNRLLHRSDGTRAGEIDLETSRAVIEATEQSGDKLDQVRRYVENRRFNPWGKTVVLFAPNFERGEEARAIAGLGVRIVRTDAAFLATLAELHAAA